MPYFIQATDGPNTAEQRLAARPEHLRYLDSQKDLMLLAGAKLDESTGEATGSIYVVDVDTREEAQAFLEGDPFFAAGVFADVQIERWRKAYVDGRSFIDTP